VVPVFVINLARDAERRAHMAEVLDAVGLAAEFVPAVDGRALNEADRAADRGGP
jgi:glycosyl transferase family 25